MLSRRDMLKSSAMLSLASTVPAFLRSAAAAVDPKQEKILVVIQLSGGNDGLNTVVPYKDEAYAASRDKLRLKTDAVLKINDEVALHPAMQSMADLLNNNRLAIVQGVGYPEPNRSHDVSMAIWQTASVDPENHNGNGWLGRALDESSLADERPASLLVADETTPQALRGRKSLCVSMDSLNEFDLKIADTRNPQGSKTLDSLAGFMQRSTLDAYATAERIQEVVKRSESATNANLARQSSNLARRLKIIADLIQSDFGPKVYYCMQPGYDTHSNQLQEHAGLLNTLSRSLKAFLDDIQVMGLGDQVLVLCFSEFGRQVQENASAGTDHGTAGPVFLAGNSVQSGFYGKAPDLTKLTGNAPDYTVDFRSVYAAVLQDWLSVDRMKILPSEFKPLELLRHK